MEKYNEEKEEKSNWRTLRGSFNQRSWELQDKVKEAFRRLRLCQNPALIRLSF
jgi:hypothetical protein